LTDEELMTAYANGDRRSFVLLFQRWAPRLHGFFQRTLGDQGAADDLLQGTFLKLHRARTSFQPLLHLRGWIYGIATHELQEELRRRKHTPLASEEAQQDVLESAGPDMHNALESKQFASQVRAAIDRLPESQRAVLYLHRFEEMGFAEIAKLLGTTEGAVKLRAFRAYERLRQDLVPLLDEERAA
jgi:RNA polymerase sigma-70 factor (ECF subfamily)